MNNYSNNQWLNKHLNGPDAHLWFTARRMLLLKSSTISALDLFNKDHMMEHDAPNRNGQNLNSHQEKLNTKLKYLQRAHKNRYWVQKLIYDIVTRWKPEYLDEASLHHRTLHHSLIDMRCKLITSVFGRKLLLL
jgi:hypothetical protein